ncbi:MAG TPA: acyl-CoA desaturase [Bacillales bacterium]
MKELHSFGWYAGRVAPHLPRHAFKPVPARLWGGLAYMIVTIAGFLAIGLFDLNLWLSLLISVVLGASFAGMGFLGHEILHGAVVRKRWLRDLLGALAFWPLSTGPRLWRMWHNSNHHKHTQDEEHDPDSWPSMKRFAKSPFLRWVYRLPFPVRAFLSFCSLAGTFSVHSISMFGQYIREFKPEERKKVWLQLIAPWVIWIGLLFVMGPVKWFFAFLLPLLIANFIVMCYISTNHRLNPLVPVNDPLANSLSVTVPRWVDFIHFNFSYHTEHHLFPGMSARYYPQVKKLIKEKWPERYHEMPMGRALKALWKTPRVYYKHNELIDPHQGHLYGSLGNGLDPAKIRYRKKELKQ